MEIIKLEDRTEFAPQFMPRILRVRPDYKVPLICMDPGQEIAPHKSGQGVFYVVSGNGVMTVEGKEHQICAGSMIFVEKGEERGIRATERLVAFAVHMSAAE